MLDTDHYDLEKIKERILESLAVAKLKGDVSGRDSLLRRAAGRRRMLVELEERLSPGGLGRARAFFEPLGYRAVFGGRAS